MENLVDAWFTGKKPEKNNPCGPIEDEEPTSKQTKKKINSWDCSTPTPNDKHSRGKVSNWDSSSECQETMVEPFDNNDRDIDNWDTESENQPTPKKENKIPEEKIDGKEGEKLEISSDSISELFLADLSDIDKSSIADLLEVIGSERKNVENSSKKSEQLCLEDIEEVLKNSITKALGEPLPTPTTLESGRGGSATAEDATVWMIPESKRTSTGENTPISVNDLKEIILVKKAKSFPEIQEKSKTSCHSERSCDRDYIDIKSFLSCEGSVLPGKENSNGKLLNMTTLFTKYECRTMTMDNDAPEKLAVTPTSNFRSVEVVLPDYTDNTVSEDLGRNNENSVENGENANESLVAGLSAAASLDVVSLPDMIGRNSIQERSKKLTRRINSPGKGRNETSRTLIGGNHINESWFLLDETGQYQAVTRNEVTILLNGRSADAVLQGQKEHVVSSATLAETISPSASISGGLTKESLQQFLWQEDTGGEGNDKKHIDLERKMENTLLYIQPGLNLTASIRIIPVDTEMIHLWRRTRDNGSLISSEVDLRHQQSQDSMQNVSQQRLNGHFGSPNQISQLAKVYKSPLPDISSEVSFPETAEETQMAGSQLENRGTDFSSLLIETRMIVDGLTNNFKLLQNRLDGETSRSLSLQGEVNKLRHLLRSSGGKIFLDKISRETITDQNFSQMNSYSCDSILTVKPTRLNVGSESMEEQGMRFYAENSQEELEVKPSQKEKEEACHTESSCITVNIYTMEGSASNDCIVKVQETNSLLQTNLRKIEKKMQHLQEQNEEMTKENLDLKKKLEDISLELEKYLAGTSEGRETCVEEDKESEILRDQVCNLKLELDFLKKSARSKEKTLKTENAMIQDDYTKTLISLEQWETKALEILKEINKIGLEEIDLLVNPSLDVETIKNPQVFQNILTSYLKQISDCMFALQKENFQCKQISKCTTQKELASLDRVISGYDNLINECKKGSGDSESNLKEDYFVFMMEKASLLEEIKILKTENEMLLESQMEHYEKLKQTLITLKDRKSEIAALETSQRLSEEERERMAEVVKLYEEEKKALKAENIDRKQTIEALLEEKKCRGSEIKDVSSRLQAAVVEIKNLEKTCRLKDELINEFKMELDQLLSSEEMKDNQIEVLTEEMKKLKLLKDQIEYELTTTNQSLKESHKEMTEYISHLETLVNNLQDSLDKTKEKLKESSQAVARLKKENDLLDKQHHCDVKLYNQTKDELENCKESLLNSTRKLKNLEKERETLLSDIETLSISQTEKSENLAKLDRELKALLNENTSLKEKLDLYSKDRDETLKEQKDLINKYAILSKEIQKLQDKYKNVKAECNERTNLITYLEMLLKESIQEYNNRIACLEGSITHIIEKIAVCQSTMREKHSGVESEVMELRRQLDVTCKERQELENVVSNYYSLIKHLENEIQDRERKVEELHVKLSLEQQKATDPEISKISQQNSCEGSDRFKIENLETLVNEKEKELFECRMEVNSIRNSSENERKKMELIIADLKSEIKRYQIKLELLMKNITNCNTNNLYSDKRNAELADLRNKLEEKEKQVAELSQSLNKCNEDLKMKINILENLKRKNILLNEEVKNQQVQFSKIQETLGTVNKSNEIHERERSEMAEKLVQSIKLIVEEKSARQAAELLMAEKEKTLQEQIAHVKDALFQKSKESESLFNALENKKKILNKLKDDFKKMKSELFFLRTQVANNKSSTQLRKNPNHSFDINSNNSEVSNFYSERFGSCVNEVKELRELNLQLRKSEGQCQAKIVRLEDEIRNARLLIQELQGDIKTHKKSNKMFRNMISSAKTEIEKCLLTKQLVPGVADKINRYLCLTEIPSRELLSGFRINS